MPYALVGEAPNAGTVARPDLWLLPDESGLMHTANRLARIAGYDVETFCRVFPYRTNVWMTPARLWIVEGRRRAALIADEIGHLGLDGVVLLGARAAVVYGADQPDFAWRFCRGMPTARVPHTSGRCRYWNEPRAKERARAFFEGIR